MLKSKKIIHDIFGIFDPISEQGIEGKWGDTKWTSEIKSNLCDIGHSHNFNVSASNCKKADQSEWLYDMVWMRRENNFLNDVVLAMECEWNTSHDEILYDFDKLLVVKSNLKLMIFQQRTKDQVLELFEIFKIRIKEFKNSIKGEYFLFSGYNFKTTGFEKTIFVHQ